MSKDNLHPIFNDILKPFASSPENICQQCGGKNPVWTKNHCVLTKAWIDKLLDQAGLAHIGIPEENSPAKKLLNLIEETIYTERERWVEELESERVIKLKGLLENQMKLQMRINMPNITAQEQEETWQRYCKLNHL